jgi:hypothetical protein
MTGAPSLKAMDLGEEMSKLIRNPVPVHKAGDEYRQLFKTAKIVFGDFLNEEGVLHDFVYIDCEEYPIYRFHVEDKPERRLTDFITRYRSIPGNRVLGQGEPNEVFILIHYSAFAERITFEEAENLLKIWGKRMQDALESFAENWSNHPPTIIVKLYQNLEDVNHNPMLYYDLHHGGRGNEDALPKFPMLFVDCSPPQLQKAYSGAGLELNYGEIGVPDFSLFFTIIDSEKPQIDDLKHLGNTIGSGFNIIQKTDNKDTKTPAAHVLNMCSVLCTRLILSAPEASSGESETLRDSYLRESFIGSRRVKGSKSSGLILDQPYLHRGVIDNSMIEWLSKGWKPSEVNVLLHEAIESYDKELHNCSNGSANELRDALEIMQGNWKSLTFHFLPPSFIHPKRSKVNSKNDIIVDEHYIEGVLENIVDSEEVNQKIRTCSISSIRADFSIDEFREFYSAYSGILKYITTHKLPRKNLERRNEDGQNKRKNWNSLWENCQKISHSDVKHNKALDAFESLGVKLKLISRLLIYNSLRDCLSKFKRDLLELRKKNLKIHDALSEVIGLKIDGGGEN